MCSTEGKMFEAKQKKRMIGWVDNQAFVERYIRPQMCVMRI
jgi:hypothetical protein